MDIEHLLTTPKLEVPMSACCLNVQSFRNKIVPVVDAVCSHSICLLSLTEI